MMSSADRLLLSSGVGAILIAPLIKVLPTRTVLAGAVVAFAVFTSLLMIIDAATGGHIREPGQKPHYGSWDADAIFPIWGLAGIAYGMVELIRRVIPADISESGFPHGRLDFAEGTGEFAKGASS